MLAFLLRKDLCIFVYTLIENDDFNSLVNGVFVRHKFGHHDNYNYGTPLPHIDRRKDEGGDFGI